MNGYSYEEQVKVKKGVIKRELSTNKVVCFTNE